MIFYLPEHKPDKGEVVTVVRCEDSTKALQASQYYHSLGSDLIFLLGENLNRQKKADFPDRCHLIDVSNQVDSTELFNGVAAQLPDNCWILSVDFFEEFRYPHQEDRSLKELVESLKDLGKSSIYSVIVDLYGEGQTMNWPRPKPKENWFLEAGLYFDAGPIFCEYEAKQGVVWARGGPTWRLCEGRLDFSPRLNRIPLIEVMRGRRWDKNREFIFCENDKKINWAHDGYSYPTAALLSYRLKNLADAKSWHHDEQLHSALASVDLNRMDLMYSGSQKFSSTEQLEEAALMSRGAWL